MKNSKTRYRVTLVCLIVIAVIAVSIAVVHTILGPKESDEHINTNVQEVDTSDLPDLELVGKDENPMMYDYLRGGLGRYWDHIDRNSLGFFCAMMWEKDDLSKVWGERYYGGDRTNLPWLSDSPCLFRLEKPEQQVLSNILSWDEDNRYWEETWVDQKGQEHTYCLALVSMYRSDGVSADLTKADYASSDGKWGGLDLNRIPGTGEGLYWQEVYEEGHGWDAEWLRRYPEDLYSFGIDVSNPFWDEHPLYSVEEYKNEEGVLLEVEVTQLDEFSFEWNGQSMSLKKNQLDLFLQDNGF